MPLVKVEILKGKSVEYKKAILDGIHSALVEALIVIHEPPMENWGVKGGKPASEVNLGFNVNV